MSAAKVLATLIVLTICGPAFAPNVAKADPGNFITIIYQGEQIFHDGAPHRYLEIPNFLYKISEKLDAVENEARAAGRAAFKAKLPGYLDLDDLYLDVSRYIAFEFSSLGGGHFNLAVRGLAISGTAYVSLDNASFLADARLDFSTSSLQALGTTDLFTGTTSIVVAQPQITLRADYGGIGAELANIISLGYVDHAFEDLIDDIRLDVDDAAADAIANLEFPTTLFGIEQFIPSNLTFHGIDVRAEVIEALSNIPAGNIVSAYYSEGINKYQAHFELSLGNNLTIILDHHNTNGTCTGSCRNQ